MGRHRRACRRFLCRVSRSSRPRTPPKSRWSTGRRIPDHLDAWLARRHRSAQGRDPDGDPLPPNCVNGSSVYDIATGCKLRIVKERDALQVDGADLFVTRIVTASARGRALRAFVLATRATIAYDLRLGTPRTAGRRRGRAGAPSGAGRTVPRPLRRDPAYARPWNNGTATSGSDARLSVSYTCCRQNGQTLCVQLNRTNSASSSSLGASSTSYATAESA